jgi:hypothetical protein
VIFAVLVESGLPYVRMRRPPFLSTWVVLTTWLIGGFILSLAYKSILRAVMATVTFAPPVDTGGQILALGLPVMVLRATVIEQALK